MVVFDIHWSMFVSLNISDPVLWVRPWSGRQLKSPVEPHEFTGYPSVSATCGFLGTPAPIFSSKLGPSLIICRTSSCPGRALQPSPSSHSCPAYKSIANKPYMKCRHVTSSTRSGKTCHHEVTKFDARECQVNESMLIHSHTGWGVELIS